MKNYLNQATQQAMSSRDALEALRKGNSRFVLGQGDGYDAAMFFKSASKGQFPFAVIHGCIDSRAPIEEVFDQTIGDIFVSRVAGNVINADVIASIEYACGAVGSKLIVVLGHSDCGAVKAACDNIEMANVTKLLNKIKPAILTTREDKDASSQNRAFVDKTIKRNVALSMCQILRDSELIRELIQNNTINMVGGVYDVSSGKVVFDDYSDIMKELSPDLSPEIASTISSLL